MGHVLWAKLYYIILYGPYHKGSIILLHMIWNIYYSAYRGMLHTTWIKYESKMTLKYSLGVISKSWNK